MAPGSNPEMRGGWKNRTCRDIGDWVETIAPAALAEPWDHVGWMTGNPDLPLSGVLVCLDVTEERVREAGSAGLNLIISHHPPIFSPLRSVTADTREGRLTGLSWQARVQVFSAHTNYDAASGGLSDLFARTLELENILPYPGNEGGTIAAKGRFGTMGRPCDPEAFLRHLRRCLDVKTMRLAGPPPEEIERVITLNGSYDREMLAFLRKGAADVLVTGDVKYHDALDLAQAGVFTVDAGHFFSERMFVSSLADRISVAFPGLDVRRADEADVYTSA